MLAGPVDSESVSCQTPKRSKRSDGLAHSKYDIIEKNENKQALLQEKKIGLNGDGRTCVEDSMAIGDERPSTPTKKRKKQTQTLTEKLRLQNKKNRKQQGSNTDSTKSLELVTEKDVPATRKRKQKALPAECE